MRRSSANLVHLAKNGAGLDIIVPGSGLSQQDLVQIAKNLRRPGDGVAAATLLLRETGAMNLEDMVQVARNGNGQVRFAID
jgi:hypothetical protein